MISSEEQKEKLQKHGPVQKGHSKDKKSLSWNLKCMIVEIENSEGFAHKTYEKWSKKAGKEPTEEIHPSFTE